MLKSGIGCAILGLRGKVWISSLHCAILEFLVRAEHIINACVTLRNAAFCAWRGRRVASAKVESRSPTTLTRRVGKGLGILLHYAKESNERHTKSKLKDQRCVRF